MSSQATTAAVGISCFICTTENARSAQVCRRCATPLLVSAAAGAGDRRPHVFTVLGAPNAGKTVFLAMLLDMLVQRQGDTETMPRGTFSVELQQFVLGHLASRRFPPKTMREPNTWNWALYETRKRGARHGQEFLVPDLSGAALAAEIANPGSVAIFRPALNLAGGFILCIDAAAAAKGDASPDMFALQLVAHLDSVVETKRKHRIKTPTAVVLCKSDHCPEAVDDPRAFCEANLPRLWSACASRFDRVEFFAASVAGSVAFAISAERPDDVEPVPLHIAPRGILEPFDWLLARV